MRAFNSSDNTTVIVQSGEGSAIESPPQTALTTELGGALNELELTSNDSSFDAFERLSQGRQFIVGDWNPNSGAPALPSGYSDYKVGMRWRITDDGSWSGNSDLQAGVTSWEANDWATVDINGVLRAGDNVVLADPQRDHYRGDWPAQGVNALTEDSVAGDYWSVRGHSFVYNRAQYAFAGDMVTCYDRFGTLEYHRLNGHRGQFFSGVSIVVDNDASFDGLGTGDDPVHHAQAISMANQVPFIRDVHITPAQEDLTISHGFVHLERPIRYHSYKNLRFEGGGSISMGAGSSIEFHGGYDKSGVIELVGYMLGVHPSAKTLYDLHFSYTNLVRPSGFIADNRFGSGGRCIVDDSCIIDGMPVSDDPDFSAYFRNTPYYTVGNANIPRNIICNLKV